MYIILNLSCLMHIRNSSWNGQRHMHTGLWKTGNQSYSVMSQNSIYLGLMVVAGVGGSLGKNLTRDMSGRR